MRYRGVAMFESKWAVPAGGFQWADRRAAGGRMGRYLVPIPSPNPPREYDVFSHSALFRTFASVEPTEAGILSFANRYGLLGGACSRKVMEPDPIQPRTYWTRTGALLEDWKREIGLMRHVVVDL